MTHSESLAALWPALIAASRKFGALTKDGSAQIGNSRSYRYSTLGQVLDAVKPALLDHDLLIVWLIDDDEAGHILRTRLVHAPTAEYIETKKRLPAVESMQALGSAVTYIRRYEAMCLLGLSPVDDDDGSAASAHEAHRPDVAAPGPTSRPRRPKGPRPSTSTPPDLERPAAQTPSPHAPSAPYGVSDTAVAVVEDRPAKDGTVLHWVRDVADAHYYTRDGILAHRLAALAGSGEIVRLTWQTELVGDRVVRQLRGVVPAVDDGPPF
jgi:hypothetical protein